MSGTDRGTSDLRAWSTLALFSTAYFFSMLDRQILAVLVEPVKADLQISDTQFGLLQGLAFAIFYTSFGVPIAIFADRWNRKLIIAGGIAFWSLSTVAAGLARSFPAMFGARIGVGLGEACLAPAAYSILSDLFRPQLLGRAIGIMHTIAALGIAGSAAIGGFVFGFFSRSSAFEGYGVPAWGMTLIAVGVPGMLLALVVLVAVKEPLRKAMRGPEATAPAGHSDVREGITSVLKQNNRFFVRLLSASSLLSIGTFAVLTWSAAYLLRVFHLSPEQLGIHLGIALGLGALLGPLIAGAVTDAMYARRGADAATLVLLICSALLVVSIGAGIPLADGVVTATIVIAIASIAGAGVQAAAATVIQLRAPEQFRARVSALWLCCNNLVGLTLGALLVGALTDAVFRSPTAIGLSIAVVTTASGLPGTILVATLLRNRAATPDASVGASTSVGS
jgi:MFS family permease